MPGRGCRQPGRWLPFGLRYPFHSGKNALTPRRRLRRSRSAFPKTDGGDSLVLTAVASRLDVPHWEHVKFSDGVRPGRKKKIVNFVEARLRSRMQRIYDRSDRSLTALLP